MTASWTGVGVVMPCSLRTPTRAAGKSYWTKPLGVVDMLEDVGMPVGTRV
jgi:hypothetical protein